ncbi:MAG: SAM-dependent methyltransferase [Bacteroidales bacterium]
MTGKLFVTPAPLCENPFDVDFIPYVYNKIRHIRTYIVEEEKTAKRILAHLGLRNEIHEIEFLVFNEHSDKKSVEQYLHKAIQGYDVGLMSEAGYPAFADPGSEIVLTAHKHSIQVVPLIGPSSITLALVASGLCGQNFTFRGYLPIGNERTKKILAYEQESAAKQQTQIFIETPYRNLQLFQSLIDVCSPETLLCIACQINTPQEYIVTKSIKEWKKISPEIHKLPAVFLMLKK